MADLIKAGHRVAGTVRDPEGRNQDAAKALRDIGVEVVDIDVTEDASVEAGVAAVEAAFGHVDVLVNNAGAGAHGLQENFSGEDFQRIFDVNVFGVQRMTRTVLPKMRERRSGLILNVTSLLGRVTIPFLGPYNAAKWAVEAMSENYRWELSQFGVDVAVIEPGGFPTNFFANLIAPTSRDQDASYGEFAGAPEAMLQGMGESLANNPLQVPQIVADAVLEVIHTPAGQRKFRNEVDKSGMAEPVIPMNKQAEAATKALFTAYGMDGMMTLNTAVADAA
ncbi:SDR family NAD(P)-dependent oxidoreductase [Ruegeria sp. 2205SS24-7]|uniref:SDR family NAD(P)-dependent oxidoreductase n=1 Tax=Ruegeria discodermiae TaxID=3064389 RepID=UPI002741E133|nr:SDR family NAD(P)-dependent oxidoreductase [Ruegeria sp. 2205SS24-7]MDP5218515.1 SDR family NAD(P)-dependent oxidoreductase [Ruegeria sp. 2205SS24-7]